MIAIAQKLPMVLWTGERQVPLSEGWIAESIDHSAQQAGYQEWTWSNEVAYAISYYLQQEYSGCLITKNDLEEVVKRSIEGIGHDELAQELTIVSPRVNIYLPDLARETAYELLFFKRLQEKLEEAIHVVMVRGVKLEELRTCVKIMSCTPRWKQYCQHLHDEIIHFTRQQINKTDAPPMELVIT